LPLLTEQLSLLAEIDLISCVLRKAGSNIVTSSAHRPLGVRLAVGFEPLAQDRFET
jgi:hypothetical protein